MTPYEAPHTRQAECIVSTPGCALVNPELPEADPAPEDGGVEDDEEDEQDHSQEEHRPRHPRVRPEHEGKRSEEDDPASFR